MNKDLVSPLALLSPDFVIVGSLQDTHYTFSLRNNAGGESWIEPLHTTTSKSHGYLHKNGIFTLDEHDLEQTYNKVLQTIHKHGFPNDACNVFLDLNTFRRFAYTEQQKRKQLDEILSRPYNVFSAAWEQDFAGYGQIWQLEYQPKIKVPDNIKIIDSCK